MHYVVRMDALEAYSQLLAQKPAEAEAAALDPRNRLQTIRQGSLFMLDAAIQAAQLAHGYTAKCNACNKAGCRLYNEVQSALERSQLFEHIARSILHDALAQTGAGRALDDGLLAEVRYLGEAGLKLVRGRLPPRTAELQQFSKVATGPCWQYVLALQVVQMLHAADGGPLYGLQQLIPLLPPDETDPENAMSPSAAAAATARKLGDYAAKLSRSRAAVEAAKQAQAQKAAVTAGGADETDGNGAAAATGGGTAALSGAAADSGAAASGPVDEVGNRSSGTGDGHGATESIEGIELLDTVFAEIAMAVWMSSHDPQRFSRSRYDDDDCYDDEEDDGEEEGEDGEVSPPAASPSTPTHRQGQKAQQQPGSATGESSVGLTEQRPAGQAASGQSAEQAGPAAGPQSAVAAADTAAADTAAVGLDSAAQAQEADPVKRRAEKVAELRAFHAQTPLIGRKAAYTMCVRLVNVCMESSQAWQERRAAEQGSVGQQAGQQPASPAQQPTPASAPLAVAVAAGSPPRTSGAAGAEAAAAAATAAPSGAATAPVEVADGTAAGPLVVAEAPACDGANVATAAVPGAVGAPVRRLIPEQACLRLALDALECSAFLMRRQSQKSGAAAAVESELEELDDLYDSFDAASYLLGMAMGSGRAGRDAPPRPLQWWRAAVAITNMAASRALKDQCVWDDQFRLRALRVRLPPLATALPALPPPNVGRALEAGVLPCLERVLRRGAPVQSANPYRLESLLSLVLSWPNLGWLMAYGDPHQAAALLVSVGKLLRRETAAAVAATSGAADGASTSTGRVDGWRAWEPVCKFGERLLSTGLSMWAWLEQLAQPPVQKDAAKKKQDSSGEQGKDGKATGAGGGEGAGAGAAADGAVLSGGGAATAAPAAGSASGDAGDAAKDGAAAVPGPAAAGAPAEALAEAEVTSAVATPPPRPVPGTPEYQLAQLISAATSVWLPALSELARSMTGGNLLEGKDGMSLGRIAVNWSMAIVRSCAKAQRIAASARAEAEAAAAAGDEARGAAAEALAAEAEAGAEGYRELLLQDVRYADLLATFGTSLDATWIPDNIAKKAAPLVRQAMKQVENLRDAISRAHAVVMGDAIIQLADTFPDALREALTTAARGAVVSSKPDGADGGGSGAAAAGKGGGRGRGGSRGGAVPATSAAPAQVPEVMLPAAPLVVVLRRLMGPNGLAPSPRVLNRLAVLFADSAAAGGTGSGASTSDDAGGGLKSGASPAAATGPKEASTGKLPELPLLVSPQEGRAVLPRGCAYPGCGMLEGDSELSVPLRSCRCRRVQYCDRKCQVAHWRLGHKVACTAAVAEAQEGSQGEQERARGQGEVVVEVM
ncbi:hypothetical protein GPECTOR_7g1211 [Gonium pectorale]|uniref:phytol kinase n=1 Tax=Gonium pectorale TaxID=33097 RepID=A0A150GTX9_GONPE|nr:hypothetical protein GPECTOR_7g1211 [Gonium pectorale]|eukprot:KXZ53317.1 hypothetical protein GPECTOR_7g1211 [Gonium pectorale]